ncbi:MAG: hypothetical protein V4633_13590 [Pseudomonadota bacterium]
MPKYQITGPDGNTFEVNAPDGASEEDVMAYAQKNFKLATTPKKAKPFGQQLNDFVADAPRQVGLTARYGLEGLGNAADFVASPFRGALNLIPGMNIKPGSGQSIADGIGLPQPRTEGERVIGDATRMVAGAIVPMAAGANMARNASGVTQGVGRMLASNPATQIASAGAAGAAGGYTRETGGNETSQMLASLAAGVATPFAFNAAQRVGQAANAMRPRATPSPLQVDITINNAMRGNGMTLSQMSDDVANSIRADVAKAMQLGDDLSGDAVRRLADYRMVKGMTPTRASLTRDPAEFTQQKNLAKQGANSKDPAAQQLARTEFDNNAAMIDSVNSVGASTADDALAGGSKVMNALDARNARAKQLIDQRYQAARDTNGRSAALDPSAFTQRANNLLDDALLGGKLPGDVRNLLNKAATGEMPLTVDVAEQFKTRIGDLQRSTIDMAERKALGMVRSALDDTPLLPGQQMGQESINAFNRARSLNRKWMGIVDRTPALQAVRDGIEPDQFVQKFIVGNGGKSNVMDVAMLKNSIKKSPEAMAAVKEQIAAHLKAKALTNASDEVGNFSESAFNTALKSIGDRKLNLFFSGDEVNQLKALGRVASYEMKQMRGSAVGNSNTAATASGMLDRLAGSSLLSKMPLGRLAQEPIQNISIGMQANRALSVPRALTDGTRQALPMPRQGAALSPAVLMGVEDEETRRKREAGLIFP